MFLWQSAGASGNEEDNHTINFSLLHKLQEKLSDIYCMRSSFMQVNRKRGSTRRNKSGLLQACSLDAKENKTFSLLECNEKFFLISFLIFMKTKL